MLYITCLMEMIISLELCLHNQKRSFTMAVIKTQFTLRLDLEDHAKIKKIAEKGNRSMSNMIETLVKNEIDKYEKNNGKITLTVNDVFLR